MPNEEMTSPHLHEEQVAAYLGRELSGARRAEVELHLARCAACRAEVVEAGEILRDRKRPGWPRVFTPIAAAAAALLLFAIWPQADSGPTPPARHRDSPVGAAVTPVAIAPTGAAAAVTAFVWSRTPGADQYRLTLYDEEGAVLWKQVTADSQVTPPDSLPLHPGHQYLWSVEARVGWDAWESSELTPFRILTGRADSAKRQGDR